MACLSLIWKIENFSCLKSGTIRSPNFQSWEIMIKPFVSFEYIHIEIKRTVRVNNSYSNFGIMLADSKGDPLLCRQKSSGVSSNFIQFHDIKRDTIYGSKRTEFLPNDTLRVQCVLWNEELHNPASNFMCSRIEPRTEVIKKTFSWNIRPNQLDEYKLSTDEYANELLSSSGDKVAILLYDDPLDTELSVFLVKAQQIKCTISLLDPQRKIIQFMNEENNFYKKDEGWNFDIPVLKIMLLHYQNKFFSNDTLSLEFACTFSTYTISHREHLSEDEIYNEISYSCVTLPLSPASIKNSDEPKNKKQKLSNNTISQALVGILKEGFMSDFSFRVQDKTFPVHKAILSARSSVFRAMFTVNMKKKESSSVDILNVEAATFQRMLDFIYSDSVEDDMQCKSSSKLYSVAVKFALEPLKQKCSRLLKTGLCVSNVLSVLLLGDMHQDDDLKAAAFDFIVRNDNKIVGTQVWDRFVKKHPILALDAFQNLYAKKRIC